MVYFGFYQKSHKNSCEKKKKCKFSEHIFGTGNGFINLEAKLIKLNYVSKKFVFGY